MDDPGMGDLRMDASDWPAPGEALPDVDNAQSFDPFGYDFNDFTFSGEFDVAPSIEAMQPTEDTQDRQPDVPEGAADSMARNISDSNFLGEFYLAPSIEETQPTENTQDRQPDVPEGAAESMAPGNGANNGQAPPQPSKQEWDRQKPTIIALYLGQRKTAKEIVGIMEEQHNFYAR